MHDMFVGLLIVLVNALIWLYIVRPLQRTDRERRDKRAALSQEVKSLSDEIADLRNDEMEKFDKRLTADHAAHGELHAKINALPNTFMLRRECELKCGDAFERITREQQILSARLQDVASESSETKAIVTLIANQLQVSLPQQPQREKGAGPCG